MAAMSIGSQDIYPYALSPLVGYHMICLYDVYLSKKKNLVVYLSKNVFLLYTCVKIFLVVLDQTACTHIFPY